MFWVDLALKGVAVGSAIIATLRAGSRAVYLMEHDAIGIMEGPLIAKHDVVGNYTNPLFELSETFRHCVRLSLAPQLYNHVRFAQPSYLTTTVGVVEPYPLSQRPVLSTTTQDNDDDDDDDDKALDDDIDKLIQEATTVETETKKKSLLQRQWSRTTKVASFVGEAAWSTPKYVASSVGGGLRSTSTYVALTPRLASYWAKRAWYWKSWKAEEESNLEDLAEDSGKQPMREYVGLRSSMSQPTIVFSSFRCLHTSLSTY
jgi:hypothetical protein